MSEFVEKGKRIEDNLKERINERCAARSERYSQPHDVLDILLIAVLLLREHVWA